MTYYRLEDNFMKRVNQIIEDISKDKDNLNWIKQYLKKETDADMILKITASRTAFRVAKGIFGIMGESKDDIPQYIKDEFDVKKDINDDIKGIAGALIDLAKLGQISPQSMKELKDIVKR